MAILALVALVATVVELALLLVRVNVVGCSWNVVFFVNVLLLIRWILGDEGLAASSRNRRIAEGGMGDTAVGRGECGGAGGRIDPGSIFPPSIMPLPIGNSVPGTIVVTDSGILVGVRGGNSVC